MTESDAVSILMVDDMEEKLTVYEAILASLGQKLYRAASANSALEILLKEDIGLVLLDVSMPGIDGFQLAEMIREHPRFQKLPIIFISAIQLTDLDRVKAYERGAVDYVSVPIIPQLLRAKVSVFVELTRAKRQMETMNTNLAALSKRLLYAQDRERRHVARELHDTLGQGLSCAIMALDSAIRHDDPEKWRADVLYGRTAIEDSIRQIRNMSYLLHPPMLEEFGLGSALKSYIEELIKRSGIEIFVAFEPFPFPRISPPIEAGVLRIIQESLTNVVRHSGAKSAWVSLSLHEGLLTARVRDDGRGLNGNDDSSLASVGVGLSGMKQRTAELGGQFRLRNANPGAIVEVMVPVESQGGPRSASKSQN